MNILNHFKVPFLHKIGTFLCDILNFFKTFKNFNISEFPGIKGFQGLPDFQDFRGFGLVVRVQKNPDFKKIAALPTAVGATPQGPYPHLALRPYLLT